MDTEQFEQFQQFQELMKKQVRPILYLDLMENFQIQKSGHFKPKQLCQSKVKLDITRI